MENRLSSASEHAASESMPGRHRSFIWLEGLLCGALATLATPTALLLAVLLGPALVAALLDRQPGRPVARSIALCSLCGIVGPMRELWSAGHSLGAALALAADPDVLAWAWGAAACGWLLSELVPVMVRVVLEASTLSRAASLRAARARYEAEWGFAPPPDGGGASP
jgi:hypothetical protein